MIIVESAGLTDIGRKRKRNEDTFHIDDDLKLYIVADGMGGHQAGDVASRLLVDTLVGYMVRFKQDQVVEEMPAAGGGLSKEANRLLSSISLANRAIHQAAQENNSYRGMGSTVSTVFLTENTLIAANVGDSPIYLIRNAAIDLLSTPHTLMAEQETMFPGAVGRPGKNFRHILTKAMGLEDDVEADLCEIQSFSGDTVVICSDGLSDKVTREEILDVVQRQGPEKASETLVEMANHRGGDDNVTVIVLLLKKVREEKEGIFGFFTSLFTRG